MKQLLLALVLVSTGCYGQTFPGDGDAARSVPAPAGNDPPVWDNTPNPFCTESTVCAYDLLQDVTDPEGDTLTFSGPTGCTFQTGVTLDSPNKEIDDAGTGAASTVTGCILQANDGTNPNVASPAFEYEIVASGGGITVDDSGGQDHLTIQAAINAAACGELILVYTGTYDDFSTTQNCTVGNEITVQAQSAESPDVTGFSIAGGEEAHVHCSHTGFIFGEGMTFSGTNTGTYEAAADGDPERGIHIEANNCTFKGDVQASRLTNMWVEGGGDNFTMSGAHLEFAGTHDNGNASNPDGGHNLNADLGGTTDMFIYNSFLGEGGHNGYEVDVDNSRHEENRHRSDWDLIYSGDTNRGSRLGVWWGTNVVWRRNVWSEMRAPAADAGGTAPIVKMKANGFSLSSGFMLDQTAGGAAISFQSINGEPDGAADGYVDHMTIHSVEGSAFLFLDNGGPNYGPFNIKNVVLDNTTLLPGDGKNQYCIFFNYDSTQGGARGDWEQLLFVDGLISDENCTVRINDDGPNANITETLTQMEIDYSANFANITIVEPAFVSTTVSGSEVPATALSSAQTNFLPTAGAALNCSTCSLTTVDGVESTSTEIEIGDAGWFRDDMGHAEATTDTITLCGTTTTITGITGDTLTIADAVTCSGGEGVFRGTDATPNYGAVIN